MKMIYAITRYEKHQLATMNTADLAHSVQIHTDSMRRKAQEAVKAYREAAPAEKAAALQRLDEANKKIDDYIEEQRAMFESRKLNPDRAFNEAIVATGEFCADGVEILRIIKREESIQPFDDESDKVYAEDERQMSERPEYESDKDWENVGTDERDRDDWNE